MRFVSNSRNAFGLATIEAEPFQGGEILRELYSGAFQGLGSSRGSLNEICIKQQECIRAGDNSNFGWGCGGEGAGDAAGGAADAAAGHFSRARRRRCG